MITVRRADERGHTDTGWLDSRHTFSFGDYRDPRHMGFRALRVINEDRVRPDSGFATHSHRDMEIISYVLEGTLGHKDSIGNGSTIRPGEVQRMSAGTGITHSEWNHSRSEPVHFLQIWILPEKEGIAPGYEQRSFDAGETADRLRIVASREGREGSVKIHQDAAMYLAHISAQNSVAYSPAESRHCWIQVARGSIAINGIALEAGDGASISNERRLDLRAIKDAEVIVFDLA